MNLQKIDREVVWHPFTQHQTASDHLPIRRGKGAYLYDDNNKQYLDLISSWWVNIHGHAHPEIAKAIFLQAEILEHVVFAGCTHEPAVKLAQRLLQALSFESGKVFFSDDGSTSVEVALKMAYQYWRNLGKPNRKRFIAFERGYHGDTFGAMSVGRYSGFFSHFEDLFFTVDKMPFPAT